MDAELFEELQEMFDNGASMIEIYEFIEDNTDKDPCEILMNLM